MKYHIGTNIVFEDKIFDFKNKLEIKAYVVTDTGEIKYLIHNQMSEYDCMYSIMSESELSNEIKEKVEFEDKKCYFETQFGIRRIDEIEE